MKKHIMKFTPYSLLFLAVCMLSSCLTHGLDDLPAFDEAEITDVKFDFRYKDETEKWIDGEPIVKVVTLGVQEKSIDSGTAIITCSISVPAAEDAFTESIRSTVSLSNLVGKFNISTAASIAPMDGAPVLGVPGDFSSTRRYKVTAADGTTKIWTITVTGIN